MRSRIDLRRTDDTGTFARYRPFRWDRREVIVRRGRELGFNYGLEQSRRQVMVQGTAFPLVRYVEILSPPPLEAGGVPLSPEAARSYRPEVDVLVLPDAEVLLVREPDGFTDAEVDKILAAISFE